MSFYYTNEKKNICSFFNTKNFLFYVNHSLGRKKILYQGLDEIKTKIVKKFGVHVCIFQSTAGNKQVELKLLFGVIIEPKQEVCNQINLCKNLFANTFSKVLKLYLQKNHKYQRVSFRSTCWPFQIGYEGDFWSLCTATF